MANPLKWFRKNEKIMLAVFGVLLMIVFTFSIGAVSLTDILTGGSGGSGPGGDDPVVVEWSGGDLRESDFDNMRVGRNLLINYSQNVFIEARDRGGQARTATIPMDMSDGSLLELAVLSKKAEAMGLTVDDEAVLDYLLRFTDNRLKPAEFGNLWKNMTAGRFENQQLIDLFRRELMAMKVRAMMQSGSFPVSPLHKWEHYNRMERKVNAEIVEVPVDKYIPEILDPSAEEVTAFFDKYRHQFAYPSSPEPGFRQRATAAFQFIRFDFEEFFNAELASVTDEEIQNYYQEQRDEFREQSFLEEDLKLEDAVPDAEDPADLTKENPSSDAMDDSVEPDPSATDAAEEASTDQEEAAAAGEEKDELSESGANTTPTETTENGEEAVETDAPATEATEAAKDSADDATPTETKENGEEAVETDAPATEATEAAKDSADDATPDPSLTPEPQDESVDETQEDEATQSPADNAPGPGAADETGTNDASAEVTPTVDPPAPDEESAAAPASPAQEQENPEETTTDKTADAELMEDVEKVPGEATEEGAEEVIEEGAAEVTEESVEAAKYKTLESVTEEIKRTLSLPRAQKSFEQSIARARSLMDSYFKERVSYNIQRERDEELQPPALPDLSTIATPSPLQIEEIPLADELEIAEYEIGKSFDVRFMQSGYSRIFFNQVAFTSDQPLFKASQFPSGEAASVKYLYWKTNTQAAYEPELDDVREQVIAAWKKDQAIELATAAARELVAKANAADGQSLVESLNTESFETDEVTWLTGGNIPLDRSSVPRLTPIAGIQSPGFEIYETMFSLPAGQAGFALNAPKDAVYIMRVMTQSPEQSIRQAGFLQNALLIPGLDYVRATQNQLQLARTYEKLLADDNVEWQREPSDGRRR